MKQLLIILSLLFLLNPALAQKAKPGVIYDAVLTRVIDGDTVAFKADWLPAPLKKELSIRIYGIDTPEKGHRAQCPKEAQLGELASAFTKQLISQSQRHQVVLMDWDKYGGRVLGDIVLDGKSLRMLLVQNGYARTYYGEAKTSWC